MVDFIWSDPDPPEIQDDRILTYRVMGTSPATAIVSGAAAMFASNCLGQDQTIQQIQQTFGFRQR